MNNRILRPWMLAGLALCLGASSSFAAESVTYQFDDWKVVITPGRAAPPIPLTTTRPQSKPAITPSPTKSEIVPAPKVFPTESDNRRPRVEVRPVSFTQEASDPVPLANEVVPLLKAQNQGADTPRSPAPTPDDAVPPLKMLSEPTPVLDQQSLIPADCYSLPIITPRMADVGASSVNIVPQTALYRDIYFSIPFNRAEYNAYPSYRHDATMEFMFNMMRPTVIQRGTQNVYHYGASNGYGPTSGYNYAYGPGYGYGPGFPQQYYPYNYGLRIHSSR